MYPPKVFALLLPVMLALALGAAPARAETVNCTAITSLPALITVQGIYCFTGNLSTSIATGNAIDIQTNNVIVDLNGFKLGGLGAGPGTVAIGIHALNRQNLTIKNGTIGGFLHGVFLQDSGLSAGHVVEDIRADQNTYTGIQVIGTGDIVRNNQVVATGGSTVTGTTNGNAFGIIVQGSGVRVLNNDVMTTTKVGAGLGYGIFFNSGATGLAVNNPITVADRGIEYAGSTGKYRDNLTFGVTTPFTGGTAVGTND